MCIRQQLSSRRVTSWKRQKTKRVFHCVHHPRGLVNSPACQEDIVGESGVRRRRSLGPWGLWVGQSPWDLLGGKGIFSDRAKWFPSQLKSPACSHFPKAHSYSHHTSPACGLWLGHGHRLGHLSAFCVFKIFKVIWDKQNRNRKYLCLWQIPLVALDKPGVLLHTALREATISPSEMTFNTVSVDTLAAVHRAGGPACHSHSRKINPPLILNFLILTFKAI